MRLWPNLFQPYTGKARWFLAVLVLLGVILTAGGARWIANLKIVKQEESPDSPKNINKDSDNDGLKDWEEAIYRTDPQKPDTDKDGAADGEEIRMGRDPIEPGPNDSISTSTALTDNATSSANNLTRRLAENLTKEVILPQLTSTSAPIVDPNKFAKETLRLPNELKPFVSKEIKISQDNSKKALTDYLALFDKTVADAFKNTGNKSELVILSEALEKNDFSQMYKLDAFITAYAKLIGDLKKIYAPSDLKNFHLNYLNLALARQGAVEKIRVAGVDILKTIMGVNEYLATSEKFIVIYQDLQKILNKKGVKP